MSQILHLQCSAKIVGNFDKVHIDIIKKIIITWTDIAIFGYWYCVLFHFVFSCG